MTESLPSLRDLIGANIDGRYEIRALRGRGGMGAVYEALQLQLDRRVAIKVLNPQFVHRDDYVARFMQEAKTASRIRHANVVQILDFGRLPNGSVYSVMEFLEGRDLARLLKQETKLPWARARGLLLQMIRGVKAAHAHGVIHRDIKPANLFLAREPEEGREVLKVLDFGIARMQSSTNDTAALTGSADLIGTPAYMAPELARGRIAGPRTEVYSIGVVAYQMLTGELPFRGDSAFDALFRAATEPTPPLRSHEPSVPAAVEELVLRMLAKDPHDRFDDMAELQRAVAELDEHGLPRTEPITLTGPQPLVLEETMPEPADTGVAPIGTITLPPTGESRRMTTRRRTVPSRRAAVLAFASVTFAGLVAIAAMLERPSAKPVETMQAAEAVAAPYVAQPEAPLVVVVPESEMQTRPVEPEVVIELDEEPRLPTPQPRNPSPTASKPRAPQTDADVLRKLQRRARGRCAALLEGESLVVTFGIGQRGEVLAPRGSRRGAATDCAIRVLSTARFPIGRMRKGALSL